jgi:hypothetical protein
MKKLVITVEPNRKGFEQLCPSADLCINDWQITVNPENNIDADYWIVYGNGRPNDKFKVSKFNTLLVVLEPKEKKIYPHKYYDQFHRVVDTHRDSGHPRVELTSPCFPWHIGLNSKNDTYTLGYKELNALRFPTKIKNKISVICSNAAHTPGQRKRLSFLNEIKRYLGDKLVHYGRGFNEIEDKMQGIYGYRLHLCMENCCTPNYCTEKLIDSYLGWSFPLYSGCTNVDDLYPVNSLIKVDISKAEETARRIVGILNTEISCHEKHALNKARRIALGERNPFVSMTDLASRFYLSDRSKETTSIRSHKAFRPGISSLLYRMKSSLRRFR